MNRDFVLLWQGQLVSQLGSQGFMIGMIFWIKQQTESASVLGLVMMCAVLPAVVLSPIGGTFADRHSRRAIIITGDLVRGAASLGLAALVFAAPDEPRWIFSCLFVTALVNGIAYSFFRPAIQASIPDLVPARQLSRANSFHQVSANMATLLGQGVGGVLFIWLGPGVLFLANGVSYVFSAVSESFIRIPQAVVEKQAGWRRAAAAFRADMMAGLRHTWESKGLRWIFLLSMLDTFFTSSVMLLLPFYVEDVLGLGPEWYGFLMASLGAGSAVGGLSAGAANLEGPTRCAVYLAASMLFALAMGGLGPAPSPWLALALLFLAGATNGLVLNQVLSLIQITTPSFLRGRVLGLFDTLILAMMPIASGSAGLIADLLDHNIRAIYAGCGMAMVVITLVLASISDVREFLSYKTP